MNVPGSLVHRNDSGVLCMCQYVRVRVQFIIVSVSEVSQPTLSEINMSISC